MALPKPLRFLCNQTLWSIDNFMYDLSKDGVEFVLYKTIKDNSIIFEIKVRDRDKELEIAADLIDKHFNK